MLSRSGVVLLLGLALVGCDKRAGQAEQAPPTADEVASAPATPAPAAGTFDRSHKGEAPLPAAITAPDGKDVTLASFRGKPLLVNLWATWCAPCVAEMPTLDRLAGQAGDRLQVVAVSQDLDGAAKVRPFFAERGFAHLRPYLDPKVALSTGYGVNLPATILYDANGREVWRRVGGLDWTGAEAAKAIAEAS